MAEDGRDCGAYSPSSLIRGDRCSWLTGWRVSYVAEQGGGTAEWPCGHPGGPGAAEEQQGQRDEADRPPAGDGMRADAVKLVCICSSSYLGLHDDVRSLHTDTGKLHGLTARCQGMER